MGRRTSIKNLKSLESAASGHFMYHSRSHTDFQLEYFVVRKAGEGHAWGMYRQVLRELDGRKARLIAAEYDSAILALDVEAAENKLSKSRKNGADVRRQELELTKLKYRSQAADESLSSILDEIPVLMDTADELLGEIKETCGLRPDEDLTQELLDELDQDYWVHVLRMRAALANSQCQPIPLEIVETLALLPEHMAAPIRQALKDPDSVMVSNNLFSPRIERNKLRSAV